jgi:hypothetical protein
LNYCKTFIDFTHRLLKKEGFLRTGLCLVIGMNIIEFFKRVANLLLLGKGE